MARALHKPIGLCGLAQMIAPSLSLDAIIVRPTHTHTKLSALFCSEPPPNIVHIFLGARNVWQREESLARTGHTIRRRLADRTVRQRGGERRQLSIFGRTFIWCANILRRPLHIRWSCSSLQVGRWDRRTRTSACVFGRPPRAGARDKLTGSARSVGSVASRTAGALWASANLVQEKRCARGVFCASEWRGENVRAC